MTSLTTRPLAAPAFALPRKGRSAAALPVDPGLDALLADPCLGSTAKTIAVALVKNWAWTKDHCWPSDATIAARIGKSVGHVQRCLRQLESAGWVRREPAPELPNRRRLVLLWRRPDPGAGARPPSAPARSAPPARARDKQEVVIVNERREPEPGIPDLRPRPRPEPEPQSGPIPEPECPAACRAEPEAEAEAAAEATPPPPRPEPPKPPEPAAPEAAPPPPSPAGRAPAPQPPAATPPPPPPPSASPPTPAPAVPPWPRPGLRAALAPRRPRPSLSLEELAAVVQSTGDPILAAELARRKAPPLPPEPPPDAFPTPDLIGRLPGRHDLIAAVVHRLCADLNDWKTPSWTFFEKAARAVAARRAGPEVLADVYRQATGPRAHDRGRVFVTAWKRQGPPD